MNTHSYKSPRRDASATRTRERIVKAADAILSTADGIGEFSLEAVARKAGVTRLTVYNHFGSRRALFAEAAFDARAAHRPLYHIAEIMAVPDARTALLSLIELFCGFWNSNPGAISFLRSHSSYSAPITESMRARLERRRRALSVLVHRIGELKPHANDDLVDVLFALTSLNFFPSLRRLVGAQMRPAG